MRSFLSVVKVSLYITIGVSLINILGDIRGGLEWANVVEGIGIAFIYSFVLTVVNVYFHDYMTILYSWEKHTQKRLWIGVIGSIILTVVAFAMVRWFIEVILYGVSFDEYLASEDLFSYIFVLIIALFVSAISHAFYFYKALQDTRVKEQKIIAGTASAKFDALKNQLDPHFLFNSLNVLTSLIEEDPDQAQKFTTSLSKVYRYVLEQKNKDLVSVDEELEFAKTYVRLLKMRFEDSLVFDIPEAVSNTEAKIVPLSLQLLLENAVKHNVVNSAKPLHIKVYEDNGELVVTNNLQEKTVVKRSSGVGLQNIKQRYSILTDKEVGIDKTTKDFSVRLPMLSRQISVLETQETHIEEKRYLKAKERVEEIKGFYGNLISYCVVIPLLWWINFRTTSFLWAIFPTLGWGIGVFFHGLEAFGYNPIWGKRWEEKKIKELMKRDDF